jgi:hypothetical protein
MLRRGTLKRAAWVRKHSTRCSRYDGVSGRSLSPSRSALPLPFPSLHLPSLPFPSPSSPFCCLSTAWQTPAGPARAHKRPTKCAPLHSRSKQSVVVPCAEAGRPPFFCQFILYAQGGDSKMENPWQRLISASRRNISRISFHFAVTR